MMEVATFSELEAELCERIKRMVWCNMATIDTQQRPRSRIVQPIWEGPVCWIVSRRQGLKATHIAQNNHVSLAYIGDNVEPLYVDGSVAWIDDLDTKQHVWELARTLPPPLDYDFAPLYGRADNPAFGVLKLTPRRIELASMMGGAQIWYNRG